MMFHIRFPFLVTVFAASIDRQLSLTNFRSTPNIASNILRLNIYRYFYRVPSMTTETASTVHSTKPPEDEALDTDSKPTNTFAIRKDGAYLVACHEDKYLELLNDKVTGLKSLLNLNIGDGDIITDVYESPRKNFRMRANFNIWHDHPNRRIPSGAFYVMYDETEKKVPCEIKAFPRGSLLLNELMTSLWSLLETHRALFDSLFEARFVTTLSQQAVITLCYKKPLSPGWQAAAELAATELNAKIVGRSRKLKLVAGGSETVLETLTVRDKQFKYFQTEGAFSQPNAIVCQKMIEWALDRTDDELSRNSDLLELYCGGGTFTAALAQNFRRVLATEISKASVALALANFKENEITNIKVVRLSSEEFTDAYVNKRPFKRLQEADVNLEDFDIRTVLVDPPRSGLDDATCELLSRFERIVYISCSPETLARDVAKLRATHTVTRTAAFDQFPYTHHLESGVYLVRSAVSSLSSLDGEGHIDRGVKGGDCNAGEELVEEVVVTADAEVEEVNSEEQLDDVSNASKRAKLC